MTTILIVGFGSIGKRHLENILKLTNSKVVILTKRKRLLRLQKKSVIIVNSLQEALLHKPDIGFVANETSLHVDLSLIHI